MRSKDAEIGAGNMSSLVHLALPFGSRQNQKAFASKAEAGTPHPCWPPLHYIAALALSVFLFVPQEINLRAPAS